MTERIYISGPIGSGPASDDHGKAAFESAVGYLKELGYTDDQIVNPRARERDDKSEKEMLQLALIEQLSCDKVVFLEGWALSYGTSLEMLVALSTGMGIYSLEMHRPWEIFEMDRKKSLALAAARLKDLPDERLRAEDNI